MQRIDYRLTGTNLPIGIVKQHDSVIDSYAYERESSHAYRDIQPDLGCRKKHNGSDKSGDDQDGCDFK